MAALNCHASFNFQTTASGAFRTACSLQPAADQYVIVKGMGLSFSGVSGSAKPIRVRWYDVTGGTGGASSNLVPIILNTQFKGITPQTDCQQNYTTEITGGSPTNEASYDMYLHPQGGALIQVPFDGFIVGPSDIQCLQVLVESGETAVFVSGFVHFEE